MNPLEALSPRNPRLGEVRRLLSSASARREHRKFVVEGPRLLAEALAASWPVLEVFVEDHTVWSGATLVRAGTLDRLGDAVTSQGVLAVVASPPLTLPEPAAVRAVQLGSQPVPMDDPTGDRDQLMKADPTVLVLVDVADPGNAGTVLRSAAAAGVKAVIFAGHSVDPLSPKVVRSSAGSLFRVPLGVAETLDQVFDWGQRCKLAMWATVPAHHPGAQDLYATSFSGGAALLLGSEAHGLDPSVVARVGDRVVAVPTVGGVESLNVAMAATVVAFELLRRRRSALGGPVSDGLASVGSGSARREIGGRGIGSGVIERGGEQPETERIGRSDGCGAGFGP